MAYGDWINECIDDKPFLNLVQHEIIKQADKVLNFDNPFQRKWMYGRFANMRCRLFKADRLERKGNDIRVTTGEALPKILGGE